MPRSRQHGFTLAEVLTVLVIIAIVLSIAIPAVTNLSKASALNSATRNLSNILHLARQYAITHRRTTDVVFPYSATAGNGTKQAPPYTSYAVVAVDPSTLQLYYISRWEFLPTGTVFLKGNAVVGALDTLPWDSIPFPYTSSPNAQLAYIGFGPTGAASQTGTLTIEEGFLDNGGNPTLTAPFNSATCIVDNVVGHIRLVRP